VKEAIELLKLYYKQDTVYFSKVKAIENPCISPDVYKLSEVSAKMDPALKNKIECYFCPLKMFAPEKMRLHIGIHLALKLVPINPTTCGFCGVMGCSIGLEKKCTTSAKIKL